MNLVLMGVECFDGSISSSQVEYEDFPARRADGERDAVGHEIQSR